MLDVKLAGPPLEETPPLAPEGPQASLLAACRAQKHWRELDGS